VSNNLKRKINIIFNLPSGMEEILLSKAMSRLRMRPNAAAESERVEIEREIV